MTGASETAMTLPLGPPVDPRAARRPEAVVLEGRHGRVEKLDPTRHANDLWEAVHRRDELWTYMAYGPFGDGLRFPAGWKSARPSPTRSRLWLWTVRDTRLASSP